MNCKNVKLLHPSGTRLATGAVSIAVALAVFTLMPIGAGAADPDRGKEIFERRCTGCHAIDREKEGPRLGGVYGRAAGTIATFTYSDAVKNSHVTWDAGSLDKWLTDPSAFIPGNDMAFRLVNSDERAAIIAYLMQLSGK